MATLIHKRGEDVLDWAVDFTRWLEPGEAIESAEAAALPADLKVSQVTFTPFGVVVWLAEGNNNVRHEVQLILVTDRGKMKLFRFFVLTRGITVYDDIPPPPSPWLDGVVAAGSLTSRLLSDRFAVHGDPKDFAGSGDGINDDTTALQAAANSAAARGTSLFISPGNWRTTDTITVAPTVSITMEGTIVYDGPDDRPALVIGSGGSVKTQARRYIGMRVRRFSTGSWLDEQHIGIRFLNIDACHIEIVRSEGFTIGVQLYGDATGAEDSDIHLGRLTDNRYGLDLRTGTAAGWNNSNRFYGGHFANSSGTHPTMSRFGVRLSREPGAYTLHNANRFYAPSFELQRQGTPGTVDAIPFLVEVDGRSLNVSNVRMEACSRFVARHTGAFSDAVYEVSFVGTYGFLGCDIDYTSTASRAGGTVVPTHQTASVQHAPRLIAEAGRIRSRLFMWNGAQVGVEGMTVLSGNPSGPPTTLTGFCFAGLDGIGYGADQVTMPTSRAVAFVVDATTCKEFILAVEGTSLRLVVQQHDASETILGADATILLSNMNVLFSGAPSYFWEGNADFDSLAGGLPLNQHQRITLHPSAKFAVIGVRGSVAGAVLKAMRLYCPAIYSPPVIFGGNRKWGTRELSISLPWTVPAIAPGATTTLDVTLPDVRQGDYVQVGFTKDAGFQNGGVVFHAVVGGTGSTNQVRVTAQNITAGTITIGAGTLRVRATKPPL